MFISHNQTEGTEFGHQAVPSICRLWPFIDAETKSIKLSCCKFLKNYINFMFLTTRRRLPASFLKLHPERKSQDDISLIHGLLRMLSRKRNFFAISGKDMKARCHRASLIVRDKDVG